MSVQKPSIPRGTRDFGPEEMLRRNYIFDTIREVFQQYGYAPLETPAMENLSTLLGKYGEEGDKLLFRILNSGDFLEDHQKSATDTLHYKELLPFISEKGLRYDLTVPFARFVVQHQHEITFPFRRYQIQPVWRADRPQRGRYREFFQCDADIIGTGSLLCEVELVQIIDDIFTRFGLPVTILINNRKILAGIAEAIGAPEMLTEITVALDKTDKIGPEKVNEELKSRGLPGDSLDKLQPILGLQGIIRERIDALKHILRDSETGLRGIEELCSVMTTLKSLDLNNKWNFDMKLARGLSYYTGAIFEVKARDVQIGSICGGGRYDNLTGIFGLPGMSGVGISFGADRIFDVLSELKKFPETYLGSTRILFVNFGAEESLYGLGILQNLRRQGIAAEIYPEAVKLKKQFEYAGKKNIRWVAIAGKEEIESGTVNLKNMETGIQVTVKPEEITALI